MNKFRVELNGAGVRELMKSEEMQAVLMEKATTVKNIAGEGYESDIHIGRTRANANVRAATVKASRSNLKHNTLIKALMR